MDRNLVLPVVGTLALVLLAYLALSSTESPAPDPAASPPSSAVRPAGPTLLEQHAAEPATVQALAALADAGLGELVLCSLKAPLPGDIRTGAWPTHYTNTSAAFIVAPHQSSVPIIASDGAEIADLEWNGTAPTRCNLTHRWLYTVEVEVLEEDGTRVSDASVNISGRPVTVSEQGVYTQRRSAKQRPDPHRATTVLTAQATRGDQRGSASANVESSRVNITVVLGNNSPEDRLSAMSMQGQAMKAMASRRALRSAIDKALNREGLVASVKAVLQEWQGRSVELPSNARIMAAPSRLLAPTRIPVPPQEREPIKAVPPAP